MRSTTNGVTFGTPSSGADAARPRDDERALAGELVDDGQANALARAGDNGDLVRKLQVHAATVRRVSHRRRAGTSAPWCR